MTVVGTYELIGPVGRGSTSTVWKARDLQLDRYVALKRLDESTTASREQWRAEARTLALLSEPHIVEVYGFVEDDDAAYIVEEWVDGATLSAVLAAAGRLSTAQALGVMRGALLGLAHAHERGVIHRDVSAANILVDAAGMSRLIDFGLAAAEGADGTYGTSAYRSPEAAAERPATAASDVYSAAAVLTHLLTATAVTPPAIHLVDIGIRTVLGQALAYLPADRYPDAGAFLAALEEAAERRYGAAWWTQAGMAALAGGGGAAVATSAARDKSSSEGTALLATVAAPPQDGVRVVRDFSRRNKLAAAGAAVGILIVGSVGVALAGRGDTKRDKPAVAAASTPAAAAVLASASPTPSAAATGATAATAATGATGAPPSPSVVASMSTPSASTTAAKPPAVTPAQALAGKFAISGTWTKISGNLVDDATLAAIKPGDTVTPSQWTVTSVCAPGKPCTATVVSSAGRRYPLRLTSGHWRGSSSPVTTPCYDSNNRLRPGIHGTMVIDLDILDPSASLVKVPARLSGTQLRHYDNGCGVRGLAAAATLILTRR